LENVEKLIPHSFISKERLKWTNKQKSVVFLT
jgi:hypothetical protein